MWRLIPAFAALTSTFLWAAFNYTWWVPFGDADMRTPVLMIMHIFTIFASAAWTIEKS